MGTYVDNTVNAKQFLYDQLPPHLWPSIPTTLRLAYKAAEDLWNQEPILQVPSARANRGRIISWAVDLAFERLVGSGQWPQASASWKPFALPTGQYLEIRLPHSLLTISQVDDPAKQPRDVVFRSNARINNQGQLFPEIDTEDRNQGVPTFILLHGHQSLSFASVALPNKDHGRGHLWRTPNLLNLPHALPASVPPTEDTDKEALIALKEGIEKWLKDNDGQ